MDNKGQPTQSEWFRRGWDDAMNEKGHMAEAYIKEEFRESYHEGYRKGVYARDENIYHLRIEREDTEKFARECDHYAMVDEFPMYGWPMQ